MKNKTKILATLGPACDDKEIIKTMLRTGVDAFRFNFSHGNSSEHLARLKTAKDAVEETGIPAAFMLDTKGPEIRIKTFKEGRAELKEGELFSLHTADIQGDETGVSVTFPKLKDSVKKGNIILVDDGIITLKTEKVEGDAIITRIINGGVLSDNKSLNVQDVSVDMPALSMKDIDDMRFAAENDFDFVAASFIRSADDVHALRGVLDAFGGEDIMLIAKIENGQGVYNADEIINAADGLMIARGDLGVEVAASKIPIIQKDLIKKCRAAGKPVITATQMLDSMIRNPRPTRAEAADVANAVFDGSDVVMLSGETAAGRWPVESVMMMAEIISEAESRYSEYAREAELPENPDITTTIGFASCMAAHELRAAIILTPTRSGYTPRVIARFRPKSDIVATTSNARVQRQLMLTWGVEVLLFEEEEEAVNDLIDRVFHRLKEKKTISAGSIAVITAGLSHTFTGITNMLRIESVPDDL